MDANHKVFIDLLSDMYYCEDPVESPCRSFLCVLQEFSMRELRIALKKMSLNKCADDQGICLEMLKFATTETLNIFFEISERFDFSRAC